MPVSGALVTFTAPASGASGTFAGGLTSVVVATDSTGTATAPAFTANGVPGGYSVIASTAGAAISATFTLTNQHAVSPIGVAPGIHITGTLQYSGDEDWYSFQLLRPDSLDVALDYDSSQGGLGLELKDAAGNDIAVNSSPANSQIVQTGVLPAGTYYVHIYGLTAATNTYSLAIDPGTKPGSVSTTRVFYVNGGSTTGDYYATAPGNDSNDGLTPETPKATLQSLLATYTLGPNDLVLVDTGTYGGSTIQINATSQGAAYAGSPGGTTLNTGFQLNGADYDVIYGFNFAGFGGTGISASPSGANASTNNTFLDNSFTGQFTAISITSGSSDVVSQNTILNIYSGIALSGSNETVENNSITGTTYGIQVSSGGATVQNNTIMTSAGGYMGIEISGGMEGNGSDSVTGNSVSGYYYGLYDVGSFSLVANNNMFSSGQYGLYLANSGSSNQIYGNTVSGCLSYGIYLGTAATIYNNQVSTSATGIYFTSGGSLYGNQVYDNTLGIYANGTVGGSDWSDPNAIYDNQTGISVYGDSTVAFNGIYGNVVGIDLHNTTSVHNNLIYRNSGQGILVDGANNLSILNNTIYTPSGDAVRVQGGAYNVTLQNNILWTDSGNDVYVTTDSQRGFVSDYNNLYTTGTGTLVWWQKAFTDLFDWQVESGYDTHSIGYTSVAPTLDNPQFVNLAGDDYHLSNQTSTSIAAGNPASDFSQQPAQSGGRIELGAYGNTSQAALSRPSFIQIDYPNYYTDWQVNVGHAVQWHAYNVTGNVELDLYEQGVGKVAVIGTVAIGNDVTNPAGAAVVSGALGWSPAASGITGSTANRYWIQISSTTNNTIETASRENFAIPAASSNYYINDGSLAGDQWSTAVGSNRNTGTTAGDPVANLIPLLSEYALGPGTTVHIDTGNYVEVRNVVIGVNSPYGNAQGTTFTGPTNGGVAQLDRANTNSGSIDIDVNDGNFVTLENVTLVGAQVGLNVRNGSTNFKGVNLTSANNSGDGIDVDSTATASQFGSLTAHDNGGSGINIGVPIIGLSNSLAYGNGQTGIYLSNAGPALLQNDVAYDNQTGIAITNNASGTATIGDNSGTGAGDLVYGNSQTGISASGNLLIADNTAHDNRDGHQRQWRHRSGDRQYGLQQQSDGHRR